MCSDCVTPNVKRGQNSTSVLQFCGSSCPRPSSHIHVFFFSHVKKRFECFGPFFSLVQIRSFLFQVVAIPSFPSRVFSSHHLPFNCIPLFFRFAFHSLNRVAFPLQGFDRNLPLWISSRRRAQSARSLTSVLQPAL